MFNGLQSFSVVTHSSAAPTVRMRYREQLQITGRFTRGGRNLYGYYDPENWVREFGLWTPSLGWDLLPWSWFIDWFAGFSSGIKRNAFFRDVYPADYIYATYRCTVTTEPLDGGFHSTSGGSSYSTTISGGVSRTVTTVRKRLSPFGTPVKEITGLDAYKISILLGLGLGKVR